MEKFDKLSEYIKERILLELSIDKIVEILNKENILVDERKVAKGIVVPVFNPYKPLITFCWNSFPGSFIQEDEKGATVEIKPHKVEFNFYDCLELIKMQNSKQVQQISLLKYECGEAVICQFGQRFELGIITGIRGDGEYTVKCYSNPPQLINVQHLHKISNKEEFIVRKF